MPDDVRVIPHDGERVETGPVQFGEDWPGIFLRGDTAMVFALYLEMAMKSLNYRDRILHDQLDGFLKLLISCRVGRGADAESHKMDSQ